MNKTSRRYPIVAITLSFFIVCCCNRSSASETIIDTFDPGDAYSSAGLPIGDNFQSINTEIAVRFTPTKNYRLESITLAIGRGSETGLPFQISLHDDLNGLPNATLESFQALSPATTEIIQVDSSSYPLLFAGKQYWVGLSRPDSVEEAFISWQSSRPSDFSFVLARRLDGAPWSLATIIEPAYRISGTLAVPEPTTCAICLTTFRFGVLRRRV